MQVVGLRGGWHTAGTMAGVFSRLHAKRLAQAAEVVIELRAQGALPAYNAHPGFRVHAGRQAQAAEVVSELCVEDAPPAQTDI